MDLETALPERIRALPSIKGTPPVGGDGRPMIEHGIKAADSEVIFTAAPAGLELPRHSHDTENVTAIVAGRTIVTTDEGERRYEPGDWYHTSPGEMHAIRYDLDTVQIEVQFPSTG